MIKAESGVPLRVAGCAKTFPDGTRALHPFDLDVAAGETIVILGPSGCGKTTALRIIAGLESPDPGGRVFFGGEDVTRLPVERRNVGMVFQNYALFPNMSVAENVAYGLKIRRLDRAEREGRVAEMLAMMHLEPLASRRIDQLSGGQRQRVALARAVAVRPRVLLLDEPLTALDAKLRDQLRVEIDRLLRSLGITAIYVTHDQAEAMALADRVVVMDHGRIVQVGAPRDIYYAPADAFVAEFIGTMNRLVLPADGLPGSAPRGGEVMFRPEDAGICPAGEGHVAGEVSAALFFGDRTRLTVTLESGGQVIVDTSDRQPPVSGDRVGLRLLPDRLLRL